MYNGERCLISCICLWVDWMRKRFCIRCKNRLRRFLMSLIRQTLNAIWIITNGNCFHGDIARSRIIILKSDFKKESVRERINLDFPCKRIRSTGFRTGFMDIGHRQLQEISGNGSRTVGNPYPCRCS